MMNARERFLKIAHYERDNDPFLFGFATWRETLRRWKKEGMPVGASEKEVGEYLVGRQDQVEFIKPNAASLGMGEDGGPPWGPALDPFFDSVLIKDEGKTIIKIDRDGTTVRVRKDDPEFSMPQWLDFPVKDKTDWDGFKKRLEPYSKGRFPNGWDVMSDETVGFTLREEQKDRKFAERDFPLGMMCLSLYGNLRSYMGLENLSYALFEDIKLVEEMMEWQTYLSLEMLKQVFNAGVTLDFAWIFEDMCFKNGPLVSPEFVKKHMAPRYRKVVDFLRSHSVDTIIMDCDGAIDQLLPIWLDCGINGTYPLEVASGMNALELRKKYGKELVMFGNIDKRALAAGKNEIDKELEKVKLLLKDSGYFPGCDHHVPPDVPYENIVYFLNELRKLSDYEEAKRFINLNNMPDIYFMG